MLAVISIEDEETEMDDPQNCPSGEGLVWNSWSITLLTGNELSGDVTAVEAKVRR